MPPAVSTAASYGVFSRYLFLSLQVYLEDSLGERIWVDSPHCKTFVDNIQTAFSTKMPPKSILLHGEVGRSGGDLSAGKANLGRERGGRVYFGSGGTDRQVASYENRPILE